jgi:hypothetical protein
MKNSQLVDFKNKYDSLKQKTYAQLHQEAKTYNQKNTIGVLMNFRPSINQEEFKDRFIRSNSKEAANRSNSKYYSSQSKSKKKVKQQML